MSFTSAYVAKRKVNDKFLTQIQEIANWERIEKILEKYYNKGLSATGRESYPALLLFKMVLLQTRKGLSDYQIETQVNDRLSFMKFCGLRLEDEVPDHSAICRFRKALTKSNGYESLLNEINTQLETHSILVKKGTIIDASITPTPRKPKGKKEYEISIESREASLKEKPKPGVDGEASWTKKGGRLHYGYKKHYLCDKETSLVLSVATSTAKDHDSKYMENCLSKVELPSRSEVLADKGYYGEPNEEILKDKNLRSRIQSKAVRGKPLSYWSKKRNKLIGKERYNVERIFGGIKRWFNSGYSRYVGKLKTHSQHVIEAISYNLKISLNLRIQPQEKD